METLYTHFIPRCNPRRRQYTEWAGLDLSGADAKRVKKCRFCGAEIVWLKSKTGKSYPVNFNGLIDVLKTDFHKCKTDEVAQ